MVDLHTPTLIVDDDEAMRRMIRTMLRKIGFSDVTENDGTDALVALRRRQYGLVLSDLRMAPMSGLELLKLVRGEPKLASTPFIMVTGATESKLVKTALALGVDSYIVKPFNTMTLQRKVFGVLELVEGRELDEAAPEADDKLEQLIQEITMLFRLLRASVRTSEASPQESLIAQIREYLDRAVAMGLEEDYREQFEMMLAQLPQGPLTRTPHLNAVLLTPSSGSTAGTAASDRPTDEEAIASAHRGEHERRYHIRFVEPLLQVGIGGRIYRTMNWSIGGLCIAGYGEDAQLDRQINVTMTIEAVDDIDAVFTGPAIVTRYDSMRGILAARFKSHLSPTLKLLEYMTRHRITPKQPDPDRR
jgi:two-component system chemotaxis response regulator CheY